MLSILLAGCASRPVAPTESASELFEEAYRLSHDYLLTVEPTDLATVIDAENRLSKKQKKHLLDLTERGAAGARADIKAEPHNARHHLLLGLHLSIGSLGKSLLANMLEGRGSQIQRAYTESIRLDRTLEGGAALRLKGKFLMSAPWPIRDRKGAERALRAAAKIRDVPQIHFFLGDLYHAQGKRGKALREWRRATEPPPGASDGRGVDGQLRELAKRRIRLSR